MHKATILIAGGEKGLIQLLKRQLPHHGFKVIDTPDKTVALEAWATDRPDLFVIGSSQDSTWGMDWIWSRRSANGIESYLLY